MSPAPRPIQHRLLEYARTARNIAEGASPSVPLSPAGARFLANDLFEAAARIDELEQAHSRS